MEDRLTDFAASVADLYEALPRTFFGRHYGQQILRAATGAAANYAEVRAAESKNDFIHKLGIVRKELCECLVWLRLIMRKHLVPAETLDPIRDECDQLVRIVSASKITAERNARLGKKKEEDEDPYPPFQRALGSSNRRVIGSQGYPRTRDYGHHSTFPR